MAGREGTDRLPFYFLTFGIFWQGSKITKFQDRNASDRVHVLLFFTLGRLGRIFVILALSFKEILSIWPNLTLV